MIGLGGGSMQKYCYRRLPHSIISVAEINPGVIELRDSFAFLKTTRDSASIVRTALGSYGGNEGSSTSCWSTDLTTKDSRQACVASSLFRLLRSLRSQGILVVNVCDGDHLVSRIRQNFRNQVIVTDGIDDSATPSYSLVKQRFSPAPRWHARLKGLDSDLPSAESTNAVWSIDMRDGIELPRWPGRQDTSSSYKLECAFSRSWPTFAKTKESIVNLLCTVGWRH